MSTKKKKRHIISKILLILLILFIAYILFEFITPRVSLIGKDTNHKVYIAFGFHANLYHSFRDDTNTEDGFGMDIRIIRDIIDTFDSFNEKGIEAKAVWDIENLFTLEEFLPQYAPDIIEDIQRRVAEEKDEIILMSYNNALASALTEDEFRYSIEKAITNEWNSGVMDLFGEYSPIVRPQEMMATPGNYNLYKKLGVDTICLYYSAITFDAMRVFTRKLTLEEAHNPLIYKNPNTGEQMRVIPTYNIGDLIENENLNEWAEMLHREQIRGNIDNDVLIFINFDADNEYWSGMDLPPMVEWLPNAGGLNQLINDVSKLDYVEFTNLKDYIDTHKAVGEIYFGQDTADGCFNGYSSWTEKAYNSSTFTEVVKNRRIHRFIEKIFNEDILTDIPSNVKSLLDNSYKERMRLLSTTNFGLAAPFLAKGRELRIEKIIKDMNDYANQAFHGVNEYIKHKYFNKSNIPTPTFKDHTYIKKFMIVNPFYDSNNNNTFFTVRAIIDDLEDKELYVYDKNGNQIDCKAYMICDIKDSEGLKEIRFYAPSGNIDDNEIYYLYTNPKKKTSDKQIIATKSLLKNKHLEMKIDLESSTITELIYKGKKQLEKGSLLSKIQYDNKIYQAEIDNITILNDGSNGVATLQMKGKFPIELREDETLNQIANQYSNSVIYTFSMIEDLPYLFIDVDIDYPDTLRQDFIKPSSTRLIRKVDNNWKEVAPLELIYALKADKEKPFNILKNNFMRIKSSYEVDYYRHSDQNLNLANINNHITESYVGLTNGSQCIVLGIDKTISANFAFCPMKMSYDKSKETFSMKLNPFGSYYGKQYYQPTWGSGIGFEMTQVQGEQFSNSAPSYNAYEDRFSLIITFFDGDEIPSHIENMMYSFANQPFVITDDDPSESITYESYTEPIRGFFAKYKIGKGVYFYWEKPQQEPLKYYINCSKNNGNEDQTNTNAESVTYEIQGDVTSYLADKFKDGIDFQEGEKYKASIIAEYAPDGSMSSPLDFESTDTFIIEDGFKDKSGAGIPFLLQLRVFLLTLRSYID
jgi:hypothetical protein